MSEEIKLSEKILAVDQNIRGLWDALDADQQKSLKKEFFILNRYISSAGFPEKQWQTGKRPTREEQVHFVLTVNEYYNKNWFLLQQHPKLMWLLLCMCSYNGDTVFYHEWIKHSKTAGIGNKKTKFLAELYPDKKIDELELLSAMTTDKELKTLARNYGMEDAEITKKLK